MLVINCDCRWWSVVIALQFDPVLGRTTSPVSVEPRGLGQWWMCPDRVAIDLFGSDLSRPQNGTVAVQSSMCELKYSGLGRSVDCLLATTSSSKR